MVTDMGVAYSSEIKARRMADVVAVIDAKGIASFDILNANDTVLARFELSTPSFTQDGGTLTLAGLPKGARALTTGTAAKACVVDGAGDVQIGGMSVGLLNSNADVCLRELTFEADEVVTITRAMISHA